MPYILKYQNKEGKTLEKTLMEGLSETAQKANLEYWAKSHPDEVSSYQLKQTGISEAPETREARTNQSPIDFLRDTLASGLTRAYGEVESPEDIQTGIQKRKQETTELFNQRLKEIEEMVANRILRERELETQKLGEARGINIRAGLVGSSFAEGRNIGIKQKTTGVIGEVERAGTIEKGKVSADLNIAISNLEDLQNERIKNARLEQQGLLEKGVEFLEKQRIRGLDVLRAAAKVSQITWDKFKESGALDEIIQSTGESEEWLKWEFQGNQPQPEKPTYHFDNKNNLVVIDQDPETGNRRITAYSPEDLGLDMPTDSKPVSFDTETGDKVFYDENQLQDIMAKSGDINELKLYTMKGMGKMTEKFNLNTAIADMTKRMNQPGIRGKDRYISPQSWDEAITAWTSAGGKLDDFIKNFKYLVNPADPQDYYGMGGKTEEKTDIINPFE